MSPQEYIRKIAHHYTDSDSIRRILEFSSIDALQIDLDGKPLNIWHEALKEAHRQGHLDELIASAASEYPSLQLENEKIQQLKEFLSKNGNGNGTIISDGRGMLKWALGGIGLFGIVGAACFFGLICSNDIIIVLHKQGNRHIHPVASLGMLKLKDSGNDNNFISKPIGQSGLVKIEDPPKWLRKEKVIMDLQGLDNDSVTYSVSSRVYSLTKNDTIWVEVSAVPKGPKLPTYEFIRLKYGPKDFDFLSSKSSLQLKKYMIFEIDNRPDLFADRHVLRYLGDELENEKILSSVNWTENRNLQLEYKIVPIAIEKNMTITFDDINLRNAIIFFGKELGKVEEISRRGSRIILPKLVGTYPLQIFYKDSVATFKITSGYSDVSKFISREDFRRNSQKIKRVVR